MFDVVAKASCRATLIFVLTVLNKTAIIIWRSVPDLFLQNACRIVFRSPCAIHAVIQQPVECTFKMHTSADIITAENWGTKTVTSTKNPTRRQFQWTLVTQTTQFLSVFLWQTNILFSWLVMMLLLLILDVLVLKDLLNHASGKKGMSASSICLFY